MEYDSAARSPFAPPVPWSCILWLDESGWYQDAWDGWYEDLADGLRDSVGGIREFARLPTIQPHGGSHEHMD